MTGREKRQLLYKAVYWILVNAADLAFVAVFILVWAVIFGVGLGMADVAIIGVLVSIYWLVMQAAAMVISLFIDD